jgi:PhzF family phenazine biosynthesis protein
MMDRPFKQVDVFTSIPFMGNPVAVVLCADGLSTAQMQQIANWTNLSETTFVVRATRPEASYRVRIFTPASELSFAGHPTIGTAHALLEAGLVEARDGALVQECGAGLVDIRVQRSSEGGRIISFRSPPPSVRPLSGEKVAELESIIGERILAEFAPCEVDTGPRWQVVQLPDAATVLAAHPDLARMESEDIDADNTGVVIFAEQPEGAPARIEVRAFAPAHGVREDPVCGSGNASVAAFIRHTAQISRFGHEFVASQGRAMGRDGLLYLTVTEDEIRVGGAAVTCIDGQVST